MSEELNGFHFDPTNLDTFVQEHNGLVTFQWMDGKTPRLYTIYFGSHEAWLAYLKSHIKD
jgi:hypothetical protein